MSSKKTTVIPTIGLRVESSYIVATCGEASSVFELVWRSPHGSRRSKMLVRLCAVPPRQYTSLLDRQKGGESIALRLDDGYLVARYGKSFAVFQVLWERLHGTRDHKLVVERCAEVPRQFEGEITTLP